MSWYRQSQHSTEHEGQVAEHQTSNTKQSRNNMNRIESLEGKAEDIEKNEKDDGVKYEYLTFQTELPPSIAALDGSSGVQPLNVTKYNSPFTWSTSRKNVVLLISCGATFCAGYSAGSYSAAAVPLREKWHLSQVAFNTGVTTWAIGFATSPMVLAPLTEINGRRPVLIASGILFFVAMIGCAVTEYFAGMLVARFFVGVGASTFATIIGGILSDIYHTEERNTPMALYSGSALAGTGFGPLLSSFIIGRTTYRWVFYHQLFSVGRPRPSGLLPLQRDPRLSPFSLAEQKLSTPTSTNSSQPGP